ncbi:hypothetical protein BH20VER3_BH20VER3_12490 [soil metagenome]
MRAVSLRGPCWVGLRFSNAGGAALASVGLGATGTGGLKPGGGGGLFADGSGPFGGRIDPGGAGVGGRDMGGAGGRDPPAGARGFGAADGGGGRTGAAGDGREPPKGVFPAGGPEERSGKLIRGFSSPTGALGGRGTWGGEVIRTVSFFGSFKSAMPSILARSTGAARPRVSQTTSAVSITFAHVTRSYPRVARILRLTNSPTGAASARITRVSTSGASASVRAMSGWSTSNFNS